MINYEVGNVKILNIELRSKSSSGIVNPTDQIEFVDIYEDINSPTLYAEIKFDDKIGLLPDFPISGEEEFDITFQTPGYSPVTYKFDSFSVSDVQQDINVKGYKYVLKCVSKEHLRHANELVNRSYNTPIHEIVTSICKSYLGSSKSVITDPCKISAPIIIPRLRPLMAIDMIRQMASSNYVGSTYVFFENQKGFNFKVIEGLIQDGKQQIGDKTFFYYSSNDVKTEDNLHFRSIIEFESFGRSDLQDIVLEGGVTNNVKTFDFLTKNINRKEFSMTNSFKETVQLDKKNTLNFSPDLSSKYNKPSHTFFMLKDSSKKELQLENMIGRRNAYLKSFNNNFTRVYVPGDSMLKVGDVVVLNFPVASGTTEIKSDEDYTGGNYLITRLRHNITTSGKNKHYISMDCYKVGLRKQITR